MMVAVQDIQLISSEDTQEEVDVKETLTNLAAAGAIPTGGIIMWSGVLADIPNGWALCDGTNGTPNLIDKFVQGVATDSTDPGDTGGATDKTTGTPSGSPHNSGDGGSSGADANHTHSITDVRPKYYEIAFIFKL